MNFTRRSILHASAMLPLVEAMTGLAQTATPSVSPATAGFGLASDRFNMLLDRLPGGILDGSNNVSWTDFERQFSHISGDSFTASAGLMPSLSVQDRLLYRNAFEVLGPLLGFDLEDLQQTLVSGSPPHDIRLYKLDADVTVLPPVWEAAGYEPRKSRSGAYWTIGEGGQLDLADPIQRVAMSTLNNVAIIADGVLAFAPNAELLTSVMEAAAGDRDGKSGELDPVTAGLRENAVSAWYLDGRILAATNSRAPEELAESDDAIGPMPVIRTICVGVTAGVSRNIGRQAPDARAFLLLQTDEPDLAKHAAEVVKWRMRETTSTLSSLSFTNMLGLMETEFISGDVVRCSVGGNSAQRFNFAEMIYQQDTWPLAYIPHE